MNAPSSLSTDGQNRPQRNRLSDTIPMLVPATRTNRGVGSLSLRHRYEKAVLDAVNDEKMRIGGDVHDGLGQRLAGLAYSAAILEGKLAGRPRALRAHATKLVRSIQDTVTFSRRLARGLRPVEVTKDGLFNALRALAADTRRRYGVSCRLAARRSLSISDPATADHLYHIAAECVTNAVRHGLAKNVYIRAGRSRSRTFVDVRDDGRGLTGKPPKKIGMGLDLVRYRARMIGGVLTYTSLKRGTAVRCEIGAPAHAAGKAP